MTTVFPSTPDIQPATLRLSGDIAYFGTMGFEDRALTFLQLAAEKGHRIMTTYAIHYLPEDPDNKVESFMKYAKDCSDKVRVLTYDRFSPEKFSREIPRLCSEMREQTVIVDLSGMSKLGIVVLLDGLSQWKRELIIFYAEARMYHPTREAYEEMRPKMFSEFFPGFLTSNVYDILSTSSLSSVDMSGSPIALVASPTFNKLELRALLTEINPQKLFLLEGRPPDPENGWRLNAVDEINQGVKSYADDVKIVSTLRYAETLQALEAIYDEVRYTHRLVLAPTGSKMQSLAAFIFKKAHPDIHVLYPVVEKFKQEYSKGFSRLWEIDFNNFSQFVSSIELMRKRPLMELLKGLGEIRPKEHD